LILGTDAQPHLVHRAVQAQYPESALRDIPPQWRIAFDGHGRVFQLREEYRTAVRFAVHDLRSGAPGGPFDLVLCRNLAFTYWDQSLQAETLRHIDLSLKPGGALVTGIHESLPPDAPFTTAWSGATCIFRKP
ncbi:MAG: chemotaxis protein CheR, partial [Gemmatimonadota bacterium]